jgi:hypothetical protein
MNIDDELKQLELATSRLPVQDLDAETASLREGWRTLTAAIEKSGSPFDEAAFVSRLQRELAVSPPAAETKRISGGWIVIVTLLGGALAASLLLVVALASGKLGQQPIAQPTTPTKTPQNNLAVTPNSNHSPSVETPARQGINENDGYVGTWDDSLDSQISVAAAQMQTFQKPALPLDASISTLNHQLQQMAEDMDEGAL